MYAAEDGLNAGFFTFDDLPEQLELWSSGADPNNLLLGPTIINHNGDGTWGSINIDQNGVARGPYVEYGGDGYLIIYELGPGGPAECLILNYDEVPIPAPLTFGKYYVFDTFLDTYTVSYLGESITIERTSLCVWEKNIVIGNRQYFMLLEFYPYGPQGDFDNPTLPAGWWASWSFNTIDGQGDDQGAGPKSGFMNSPTGTYIDPLGGGSIIIS